jgi:hypothetical protein
MNDQDEAECLVAIPADGHAGGIAERGRTDLRRTVDAIPRHPRGDLSVPLPAVSR